MSRVVDQEARDRALDASRSFIVQAPAGSGKTGLLIQRFLSLLATVEEPEEIVAITFTRKAAGEIRQRVLTALQRAAAGEVSAEPYEEQTLELARKALERSEERHWSLTRDPRRLQARTIDSFCESLVRGQPFTSGMGGFARTVDDARVYFDEAARRVLRESRPAVDKILRHLDNELMNLRRMVARMLARRDQWLRHVEGGRGTLRSRLQQGLHDVVSEALTLLRERMPGWLATEMETLAPYAAEHVKGASKIRKLTQFPQSSDPETLEAWQGLADMFLVKNGGLRKRLAVNQGFPPASCGMHAEQMKERAVACLDALGQIENDSFLEVLAEVKDLPPAHYSDEQWQLIEALIELLTDAVDTLNDVFAEHGEVDHTAVAMSAARSLGTVGPRVTHLLVDEFQDTSTGQYRLIERVMADSNGGDGRTLFLVGDPMQSIYRFREAEVALFLRAWQGRLGSVELEPLTLTVNFRCREQVIDTVNEVFSKVLPELPDFHRGAVPYTPFTCFHDDEPGEVTYRTWVNSDLDLEARYVVEHIEAARRDGLESIAILARNRHHLGRVLDVLRDEKIRFRAVEFEQLQDRPVVRDLRSLTSVLTQPADRIAWLATLRAPWCGLSLADLTVLAEAKGRLIPEALDDPATMERLSDDGRVRAQRVAQVVAKARRNRQRASLRESVRGLWIELGGPALVSATEREDAAVYLDLLATLERGGEIEDLTRVDRRLEELYSRPDQEADGSLEIMTIHRAKGLEFDCVIVPGLGRYSRGEPRQLLQWQERFGDGATDGRLILGPLEARVASEVDPVRFYLQRIETRKAQNELRRLLYVAATRAKRRLHLLGHLDLRKRDGALAPDPRSPLFALWEGVGDTFQTLSQELELPDPEAEPERAPHPPIRRVAPEWVPPPPLPSVGKEPVVADTPSQVSHTERLNRPAGASARALGVVVHRLLERVADEGLDRWDSSRVRAGAPAIEAALTAERTPAAELADTRSEVVELLEKTLADDTGRWILSQHEGAECEMAVTSEKGGAFVESRIDRTFLDGDVRWVVDFKTARHEGSDLESFLSEEYRRYEPQLSEYKRVLEALEPEREVKTALYFPRFGRLVTEVSAQRRVADPEAPASDSMVQGELF